MALTKDTRFKPLLFCLLLILGIFTIDLQLPLGVAGGVPYVAVILVSLWLRNYKYVVFFAIICSLLTLLGFYLSPQGGELWKVVANRALALFVIWVTAVLAIQWEASQKMLVRITHESEKEKENIYRATIHGAQHITNNLMNQLKLVELKIENHPDFDKEISRMFNDMLIEAKDLLISLSSVKQIDAEKIRQAVSPKTMAQ